MIESLIDKSIIQEARALTLPISNIHAPTPELSLPYGVAANVPKYKERAKVWNFEKEDGFEPPRPVGPKVFLEVYYPQESDGGILFSGDTKNILKFSSIVGLVVKMGSACFKGERFKLWDDLPKVGDWVTFAPNSGQIHGYRGIPVVVIYDDRIDDIIEKPEYVER